MSEASEVVEMTPLIAELIIEPESVSALVLIIAVLDATPFTVLVIVLTADAMPFWVSAVSEVVPTTPSVAVRRPLRLPMFSTDAEKVVAVVVARVVVPVNVLLPAIVCVDVESTPRAVTLALGMLNVCVLLFETIVTSDPTVHNAKDCVLVEIPLSDCKPAPATPRACPFQAIAPWLLLR